MEPAESESKTVYYVVGILAVAVIFGVMAWLYMANNNNQPAVTEVVTPQPTTPTEQLTTASADITTAITGLDQEISIIGQDEQSDDDTINL